MDGLIDLTHALYAVLRSIIGAAFESFSCRFGAQEFTVVNEVGLTLHSALCLMTAGSILCENEAEFDLISGSLTVKHSTGRLCFHKTHVSPSLRKTC
jgi:hypothetical protein